MYPQKVFSNILYSTFRNTRALNTMTSKVILTCNNFNGIPDQSDFQIKDEQLPALKEGEFLAENLYVNVERRPFYQKKHLSQTVFAEQIARIKESKNPKFSTGELIVGNFGWRNQSISNGSNSLTSLTPRKLPNIGNLPETVVLGPAGIQGCIAYYALIKVCEVSSGQEVVISSAGDCLGSTAAQIAKLKGCKVIALTNNETKKEWLLKKLGIDVVLNYTDTDFEDQYNAAASSGIDCYIDNLGGEISSIVMKKVKKFGKVAVCGSRSTYNNTECDDAKATEIQTTVKINHLKMKGVSELSASKVWDEATEQIIEWIKQGKVIYDETIVPGFDNIIGKHIEALQTENYGSTIIKV